jgi:hypothetical protein
MWSLSDTTSLPTNAPSLQQDHFAVSIPFLIPISHSLLALEKQPWLFIIELFKYLIFGTGWLLAPVLQMAIFASSALLDGSGVPLKQDEKNSKALEGVLPDIEIMPVSIHLNHKYQNLIYSPPDGIRLK